MKIENRLIQEIQNTPDTVLQEVLDFLLFVKQKRIEEIANIKNDPISSQTVTRSHDSFLNGYSPEDEGLYDDD